jgi:hypothetical protein
MGWWGDADLKYQAQLKDCKAPCPDPKRFAARAARGCVRFLLAEAATADDFVPYPLTPEGRARGGPHSCVHWALSFFSSQEAAMRKHAELAKKYEKWRSREPHLCSLDLTEADGLVDLPAPSGHISLHEYDPHEDFVERVQPIEMNGHE